MFILNDYLSTEKFMLDKNLTMSECENILEEGKRLYNANPKKYSHFIK